MPLPWSRLNEIRDYVSIASLGVSLDQPIGALPIIGENPQAVDRFALQIWFKTGPRQYLRADRGIFRGFAWAASDGALAYVLTNDPYFDDGAVSSPPDGLLPNQHDFDWQSVVANGRASREFHDIEFYAQRQVSYDRFEFYYRHAIPAADEPPICIKIAPKFVTLDGPLARTRQPDGNEAPPSGQG